MTGKVFIRTFGCQMNEYDSDKMSDVLEASDGLERTDNPEDADVIIFNTCSVREKAQEKMFSDLGRIRHLKEKNPQLIIGIGGCVASQEGNAIIKRARHVDIVFGPQTLHRLPALIEERRRSGKAQVDISFPEIEKFDHLPPARVDGSRAFLSIMEGCSKYCTFCVVPYTRGEEISRPFDDVLQEATQLASQGIKELTLLGQNVNAYRGLMNDGDLADLALLLEYIHEIPGIERLRYTTSHPREVTPRLIEAYTRLPKLVSHLHLPVQSGSDRILMAMKRGYTTIEYKSLIRSLRKARPDLSISSDFIVGFPGETDEDFQQTLQLIDNIGFDASFSFAYSPRPGTPAANLDNSVSHEIKLQRLRILQDKIETHAQSLSQAMVGSQQRILVESLSRRNTDQLQGRTENNRLVHFSAPVSQHEQLLDQFIIVNITAATPHALRGEYIQETL